MPLERLGPYKLEKTLGRGGMGAVYAGVNDATGERAAVKVLSAHLADDQGFRERFKIEVETLKRLLHPNIVQLFAYGEEDGHLFYVMELVNGRSLQDELAAGRRFGWREVARIGIAVGQALKHAHDRGIIHRDLKPANLLLDQQEHIKLADFGIAKLYGGTSVTADGGVLGTADYMAPEQADGRQVTARCDLYSLGSVLYALLAGRPPFSGRSIIEVIAALKNDKPIPIRRLAPDTPEEFERIIEQLLEKDPQKRIPTALALTNRLRAMEHALSLETRTLRPDELTASDDDPGLLPDKPPAARHDKAAVSLAVTAPLDIGGKNGAAGEMPTLITSGGSVIPATPRGNSAATQLTGAGAASAGTAASRASVAASAASLAPLPEPQRATTFTTVSEADLRHGGSPSDSSETSLTQWLAIGGLLLLAVAGIGGLIVVATRQPSANQLYARVKSAAEGGAEQLVDVEPELTQFLSRFPADERTVEVEQYQEDLELYRLQRRFELRARRSAGGEGLLPVERAYLEAVQLQTSDPGAALGRFEALVAVYGGPPDPALTLLQAKAAEQCLSLARGQVERLRESAGKLEREQRQAIRQQLERAAKLAETDRPAAERIWQGIVTLYGDKAWAAALVEQARSAQAAKE